MSTTITSISLALLIACSSSAKHGDASSDVAGDPCDACGAGMLCVQRFDGTCGLQTSCVARTVECLQNICSAACEDAYCPKPYQCMTRTPCSTAPSPRAFTCYGP